MAIGLLESRCVACGSTHLCFGYIGTSSNAFVPSGVFTLHGYRTRSYVCLDCGHVSQYLPKDKIDKLKEKLSDQQEQ